MARMTYKGDHAAVFVVVDGAPAIEAKNGEAVDVPPALAAELALSPVWVAVDDKPAKRKNAKADDPANHAEKEG